MSTGLFCGQNRGRSWRSIELPFGYDAVLSLALSPAFGQDTTGYAGTENNGLLRTFDSGLTWHKIGNEAMSGSINRLVLDPKFPEKPHLAALVDAQLFVSWNRGEDWEPWIIEDLPQGFDITAFAVPEGLDAGAPVWLGSSDGITILSR